ncbi:hypothetical protein N7493_005480 [Penicillium malachiteum]|uniref:Uncharacterized protein n=1 Tax=Penicillium malachiteum TaxID=1324776 RepID=A0AAD6HMR7_9EURO|nr:hypothetical protein N7493_005480 [Penicillium malachiteum]
MGVWAALAAPLSSISDRHAKEGLPLKLGLGFDDLSRRPDIRGMVESFVNNTVQGPTSVFASGPSGMLSDLRSVVAVSNSGSKLWEGQGRFDVRLV